ncbi:hypothetical protein [Sphingobacterium pedocola]|uniref:DUF5615 domain-containing protein n=1 Tax=Sphingobacterium pedocola TaxID=2082722 RepID=A0ABR9T210_9SPHI|nr:hypothetical protein [Sphingobacterium pedocola]MBE8719370.1 hypothetical protein [Sphingobacterium pedocola]
MFVKLTHAVLRELQSDGYNVLTSVNTVYDDNPTYMPEKVDDVWEWLEDLTVTPQNHPAILVIEHALNTMLEKDLFGAVWIEKHWKRSI